MMHNPHLCQHALCHCMHTLLLQCCTSSPPCTGIAWCPGNPAVPPQCCAKGHQCSQFSHWPHGHHSTPAPQRYCCYNSKQLTPQPSTTTMSRSPNRSEKVSTALLAVLNPCTTAAGKAGSCSDCPAAAAPATALLAVAALLAVGPIATIIDDDSIATLDAPGAQCSLQASLAVPHHICSATPNHPKGALSGRNTCTVTD